MEKKPLAFVIMPFDSEFGEVHRDFLLPTLEEAGFEVRRADDLFDQRNILRDIVESISGSDLIVADLTGLNPNVFYELGIAHATRRPVILLTQAVEELPFDLRSYRVIEYSTHFAKIGKAREQLRQTAEGARERTLEFGNPFTDFIRASSEDVEPGQEKAVDGELAESNEDERGWLDHLAGLEEGYQELTRTMEAISQATVSLGEDTEGYTERIERANATAGPGRSSALRLIATEYGRRLAQYGETLSEANRDYERIAKDTQDSVEYVISHARVDSNEDRESLRTYVETLSALQEAGSSTREKLLGMRETLRGVEGIERTSTRSARLVGEKLDHLLSLIDLSIASTSRGVQVGQRKLAEDLDGEGETSNQSTAPDG
jgi:hypothetical protein